MSEFDAVKRTSREYLSDVLFYLNYISTLEPKEPTDPTTRELKVMRGLFYVHLYAALEKSVNEVVRQTLRLISANSIRYNQFKTPFSVISLYGRIKALKDGSYGRIHSNATKLFSLQDSGDICKIDESVFEGGLQNVWSKTIAEIADCFGISGIHFAAREQATIDEIVDKRNAVAHGRETALYVGERHNSTILRQKLEIIDEVISEIIETFEAYYTNADYIK